MIDGQPDIAKVVNLTRRKGTGPVRVQRRSTSTASRHATPPAPQARISKPGSHWHRRDGSRKHGIGWWRITRFPPCTAVCATTRASRTVTAGTRRSGTHPRGRALSWRPALRDGWRLSIAAQPSGKRILIVGAGPAGLSAAYHLRRLGHEVEIHDAGPLPGGMLHFGIPAYRLPRADLIAEISRIEDLGVRIVLNHKVEDVLQEQAAGAFDAVFIAIGAHLAKHVEIPARDAVKVLGAVRC